MTESALDPQKKQDPPGARRVFLALPLDAETRGRIATVSADLRKAAQFTPAKMSWVAPENYHMTLHFLASVPEAKVQQIIAGLPQLAASFDPFDLDFQGIGYFPNQREPRVMWIGVRNPPAALAKLVDQLGDFVRSCGVELVHENFHPHITLARFKILKGSAMVVKQVSLHKNRSFGRSTAEVIELMESKLGPGGSVYTVIGQGSLGPQ